MTLVRIAVVVVLIASGLVVLYGMILDRSGQNIAFTVAGLAVFGLTLAFIAAKLALGYPLPALPNKITLFRLPLEADFPDPVQLEEEVRITVIHELAHHAGIDDERLHELDLD